MTGDFVSLSAEFWTDAMAAGFRHFGDANVSETAAELASLE